MKITTTTSAGKQDHLFDVCVDVHSKILFSVAKHEQTCFSDEFENRTHDIRKALKAYQDIGKQHGYSQVRVVCEPTGEYDRKLLRIARQLEFKTSYVNPEAVAKYRHIETNDSNKTDTKDPHVIWSLADQGKVIRCRAFTPKWATLRKLGIIHAQENKDVVRSRNMVHHVICELFCDYHFDKDFLYSRSGRALVSLYGANPYRIVRSGFKRFSTRMRKAAPRVRRTTLEKIWAQATSSVLHEQPDEIIELLEMRLQQCFEDWERHQERKIELEQHMIQIVDELRKEDPRIPDPVPGVLNAKNLARLLAETGPLSDFTSWRKLMRYAGLNICMRKSGQYTGQFRTSKKGRPLLRKILQQIVLPLVRKRDIYGTYYHRKKEQENMCGHKAMVVITRHFLKAFFGWYKSEEAFDLNRLLHIDNQNTMDKAA